MGLIKSVSRPVSEGLMKCVYRPCRANGMFFIVPEGFIKCVYYPYGVNEVHLEPLRG